jgi:DDE superfamily endonuclease
VDQSGFYLLPCVVRTYAPVGQTPILHEHLSRDHLSVISAISLEGKLYMMEQERSFNSQDVVRFLRHLLRQIPGKLLLIWDGSPIHRARAVKDFLASGASSRLKLEQLPFSTRPISSRGGDLEVPQVRGAKEHLLPEPLGVEGRATQSQGAFETQKRCHPRLHQTTGI